MDGEEPPSSISLMRQAGGLLDNRECVHFPELHTGTPGRDCTGRQQSVFARPQSGQRNRVRPHSDVIAVEWKIVSVRIAGYMKNSTGHCSELTGIGMHSQPNELVFRNLSSFGTINQQLNRATELCLALASSKPAVDISFHNTRRCNRLNDSARFQFTGSGIISAQFPLCW